MARSNLQPVDDASASDASASRMERAARQAGLAFFDGRVYARDADSNALFEVPEPDWSAIDAFVLYNLAKHGEYRFAPGETGDLSSKFSAFVSELPKWEPGRSADACESVYLDMVANVVRSRVVDESGAPVGDDVKIADTWLVQRQGPDGATQLVSVPKGTAGAFRMQKAIDSVAEDQRDAAYDRVVREAIERGRNKPASAEAKAPGKRGGRPASKLDLGFSL